MCAAHSLPILMSRSARSGLRSPRSRANLSRTALITASVKLSPVSLDSCCASLCASSFLMLSAIFHPYTINFYHSTTLGRSTASAVQKDPSLLHHQLPHHIFMVRPANHPAHHLELTLGFRGKVDSGGPSGLNGLFDAQLRNVKAMLDVSGSYVQLHRFAAFHVNHVRLNIIFLHDHADLLGGSLRGLLASPGENQ